MPQRKRKNVTIAVLGYGSQGRAIALNLRDSGYDVVVGLKSRSKSRKTAQKDRCGKIYTIDKAVEQASCICFALPDHLHGRLFRSQIASHLPQGATLLFLAGASVHFQLIEPPSDCDIIMIAPHAPGASVREEYLGERKLSAFYAIHQNATGRAKNTAVTLAEALGFKKTRLIKTTFEAEALGDLFGEQAILCGGMAELIQNGFEVLVSNGIPPENAYLEVAYQLDLIINLIKRYGIEGMYRRISVAARYGSMLSGSKVIDKNVRKRMEQIFDEIKSGKFAGKLDKLTDSDIERINKTVKKRVNTSFEKAAKKFSK